MRRLVLALSPLLLGLVVLSGEASAADTLETREQALEASASLRPTLRIQLAVGHKGRFSHRSAVEPIAGEPVRMRIKAPSTKTGLHPRWYLIFPDLTRHYENANPPWSDDPYVWKGIAPIDYYRIELEELRGKWEVTPFGGDARLGTRARDALAAHKGAPIADGIFHDAAGTFRFQAIVFDDEHNRPTARTVGLEEVSDARGLSRRVTRVSIRADKSYLGRVTSFFNVPGVFGSVNAQSYHYIGVDCADMVITAWAKHKRRGSVKNHNVDMVVGAFRKVARVDLRNGAPGQDAPRWGETIRPGDFIAVRYEGATRYQHIGVLYDDRDGDGLLSADDAVIHAGPAAPHVSRLREGAFDGHIVILRP